MKIPVELREFTFGWNKMEISPKHKIQFHRISLNPFQCSIDWFDLNRIIVFIEMQSVFVVSISIHIFGAILIRTHFNWCIYFKFVAEFQSILHQFHFERNSVLVYSEHKFGMPKWAVFIFSHVDILIISFDYSGFRIILNLFFVEFRQRRFYWELKSNERLEFECKIVSVTMLKAGKRQFHLESVIIGTNHRCYFAVDIQWIRYAFV